MHSQGRTESLLRINRVRPKHDPRRLRHASVDEYKQNLAVLGFLTSCIHYTWRFTPLGKWITLLIQLNLAPRSPRLQTLLILISWSSSRLPASPCVFSAPRSPYLTAVSLLVVLVQLVCLFCSSGKEHFRGLTPDLPPRSVQTAMIRCMSWLFAAVTSLR